jgi:hypothetical protein
LAFPPKATLFRVAFFVWLILAVYPRDAGAATLRREAIAVVLTGARCTAAYRTWLTLR